MYVYTHTHTYICTQIHIYIYTYIYICIYSYMHIHMRKREGREEIRCKACTPSSLHIHMYTYVYVYICVYTYTHICMYIYTYIYAYISICIYSYIHIYVCTRKGREVTRFKSCALPSGRPLSLWSWTPPTPQVCKQTCQITQATRTNSSVSLYTYVRIYLLLWAPQ